MRWFDVAEVRWQLRSDKTERPSVGKSTIAAAVSDRLTAEGLLYSLPGNGRSVGFALVEANVPIDASPYGQLCFDISTSPAGAHFQVLLKDHQWDQPGGTLTFQQDFVVAPASSPTQYFLLKDFQPTIRGKRCPEFTLELASLRSFAVQITRSSQPSPLREQSPLPFSFTLSGSIRFLQHSRGNPLSIDTGN